MKPINILSAVIFLFLQSICFGKDLPPAIITQPANQTVCAGSPASFTVTATGLGLTYQWRKGNVILIDTGSISGATTATLTISPTTVNDSASNYNVIISEPLQPNDTSANASLTVNPLPVVVTGPGKTICYGDTIQIGGSPVAGKTYKWAPNKGLSSYTIANPMASPADTITYTLTVTDTVTGCKNSDSILIKVKPVPTADIAPGDTVNFCMGDSVILTATNGASYIWSNGSTTKSITVKVPGKFYVGVIYSNGCADYTDPTTVTSSPLPTADAGPDKSICLGDSTQLGTAAAPGMAYSWSPTTGLNYDTIAQPQASPNVTTKYILTVTDTAKGCKNTDTVVVTVFPLPIANAGPDTAICKGDSVRIGADPITGVRYNWTPATGLSSDTVAHPKASPGITTTYVLTTKNSTCSNTDTVIVTVNPLPIANAGPDKSICKGDSTSIGSALVRGVRYTWSPTSGLSSDTVAQPKAGPANTTTYTLTTTNGVCMNTDTVVIKVVPQPIANAGPDKTICKKDSVSIGSPAVSGTTYKWMPATGLNSDIVAQPNASPASTTSYTLTATNGICSNTDTVVVNVNPLPAVNAGPDKSICKGDTTSIGSAASLGITYTWAPATGLSSSTTAQTNASPTVTTIYTLTAKNSTCSNTDTVIVTVSPQPIANAGPDKAICKSDSIQIGSAAVSGVTYKWSPATGLSSTTKAQPNASPASTTTYTLTATNGICSNTDTVIVTVKPMPSANAGPDRSICLHDSASIGAASVSGQTYSWSPSNGLSSATLSNPNASPAITTTYTLTVSNGTCTKKDSVLVAVLPQPIANAGVDKSICNGDSSSIGTSAVSGVTYRWAPSTGLSSSTVAQPNAGPASTTTYTLTASNGVCSNTDTVIVTVSPKPTANAGSDKTICRNDSTSIGASSVSGLTYNWLPTAGLNSAVIAQPNASPASTTLYTLKVSNGGCSNTDTVTVAVNQLPAANVGNGQFLCDAGTVTLGGPAVSGNTYVWSPALGLNSSTISQPTANPDITTIYTLTETDTATGCQMSNQILVTVVGNNFYTGISPNGDGINDWWNIPMLDCYPTNTVIIVNRWGSEVWSADNYDNNEVKWAGKDNNGTDLPDGTYYYIIKYNSTEKKGWVFIKR